MSAEDEYAKVVEIAREVEMCMVTSHSIEGGLRSRPMATQRVETAGQAWFFAARDSSLLADIAQHPEVNAAYAGSSVWLSLSGQAEMVDDETTKHQLWNDHIEAWFPNGSSDPNVVLVKVVPESAEYWDSPGGTPVALAEMAAARESGRQPDPGGSATVQLE